MIGRSSASALRMREIDDPLLADRMHDLEDLSNRLLRIVTGQLGTAAQMGLREDSILIARNLGPAELLEYDRRRLKGVILEEGSLTAHVIIVARAMGVPVLGRVRGVRRLIAEGDQLLLDVVSQLGAPFAAYGRGRIGVLEDRVDQGSEGGADG